MMLGGGVAGSLHMLGSVAEKVMHPMNEIGGYLQGWKLFNQIVTLHSIKGRTKIYEEDADVVACLL